MKILFGVEFYYPSVGGAQEVALLGPERLEGKGDPVLLQLGDDAPQGVGGEAHALVMRDTGKQVPLLG